MDFKIITVSSKIDLEKALAIRNKVFVIEQGVDKDLENDIYESSSTHFLAKNSDKAVGASRLRTTEKGIKLERFAILKDYRGKGIGKLLCQAMIQYSTNFLSKDRPDKLDRSVLVYLHAQIQVVPFYKKLGFYSEGELFLEAGIWHQKMLFRNLIIAPS